MIEREFVNQKKMEFQIQEFVSNSLKNVGHSHTKLIKTPLGEKIVIYASRPGLVVGREGQNIQKLTAMLKRRFKLEKPQIEINEVGDVNLDASIVAERIASSLERFGTTRFKGVGHRVMSDVMGAGALGIEILISGKIPSSRAKVWRFYQGYLKKCGDIALTGVNEAYATAYLKSGVVGIQVRIMPPDTKLPDNIELIEEVQEVVEEVKEQPVKDDSKKEPTETKDEEKVVEEVQKDDAKESVEVENEDKGSKSDE